MREVRKCEESIFAPFSSDLLRRVHLLRAENGVQDERRRRVDC